MADTAPAQSYSAHVLPAYFEKIQKWLVLPLLLICEFYVMGLFSARGFVNNLADPASWSWYGAIGVAVSFFGVGLACAGIALGLSGNCAESIAHGRIIRGLFLGAGVAFFAAVELYAGISERSVNLISTPADTALGQFIGLALKAATPASIIASILLPLATVFYGFALRPPKVEADAERAARMRRELEEAQHRAALTKVKAGGLAGAIRAGVQAATGKEETPSPEDNQDDNRPNNDTPPTPITTRKRGERAPTTTPRNMLTGPQLRHYLAEDMQVFISDEDALNFIKSQPTRERLSGVKGQPWAANKAATLQRARALYGAANGSTEQAL